MQLPLPVTLPDDETFDSFIAGDNAQLVSLLQSVCALTVTQTQSQAQNLLRLSSVPLVSMVGGSGSGKSHLLFAVCHQLAHSHIPHAYLNFADIVNLSPDVLESLEQLSVVCLDGLEIIAGNAQWEEALFDLINRFSETRAGILIIASQLGAKSDNINLADLRSRLSAGVTFKLTQLTDHQRAQVLSSRASHRGLTLSDQALQYLLTHSQRDLPSLMALLDRLDKRSLQEKKKVTVALVKRELATFQ